MQIHRFEAGSITFGVTAPKLEPQVKTTGVKPAEVVFIPLIKIRPCSRQQFYRTAAISGALKYPERWIYGSVLHFYIYIYKNNNKQTKHITQAKSPELI